MVGQLLEHDVADGVQYDCLSYTWGTDSPKHVIIIDDAALPITWNLLQALNSLRQAQKTGLVWIDAICINQQDLDERSQQVQIMPNIYSGAQHVIAYLGGEADGSQKRSQTLSSDLVCLLVSWQVRWRCCSGGWGST
jgi:hypothetical protein